MNHCILVSKNNYWSEKLFGLLKKENFAKWHWLDDEHNDLTIHDNFFKTVKPSHIFFFHYSKIVPKKFIDEYRCIGFHTSNLPMGKGGSPIQNQIKDEVVSTMVNMFHMTEDVDSGSLIYGKPITLQGNLSDIWGSITQLSFEMIAEYFGIIIKPTLKEKYQRISDNTINFNSSIEKIYDKIRMLDGDNYPHAYIEIGNFKLKFNRAFFDGKKIISDVVIEKIKGVK